MGRALRPATTRLLLVALALILVPIAPGVTPSARADEPPASLPGCVHVREDARDRAVGYDHWVVIRNACEQAAVCEVTTDVNPDPRRVTVAAGGTEEVLTWRSSPARTFRATVRCTLESPGEESPPE